MWLILLLIIFVLFFINIEIKRIKITKKYGHIKGSKEYPIVGNITSIKYHQLSDFNLILNELCPEPISKVTAFGKVMFVISDPTVAQTILSSPVFHKRSFIFKFFEMQNALFTTDYETWKPLRKGVNGAFNKKGIATMAPVFNKHIDGLCNAIEKEYLDRDQFDIYKIIAKFEINKVVETMLNVVDYNSSEYLVNTLQDAMDSIGERIFNPIYYPDIIFRFTSACAKLRKGHSLGKFVIQEVFGDSFEDKRKHFEENNNNNISKKIFIDELLKIEKEGQYLSYDEVVDNFKTIVMSGFETQSLAMGWIILMLAMFSETDQKVYQEICENYDESNHINEELVKKLAYLDMVIKETLRLFPVAPVTMRDSLHDVNIEPFGNISGGTPVLVAIYKIHRCPSIWGPNADQFNPENFLPQNVQQRHPYSYIPFGGGGARNCIGIHYATLNMKMVLVKLLLKFKFSTPLKYDSIVYKYGVTLKLNGGFLVSVHPRKQHLR